MAAQADKRGLKRICMNCGTRFYDLDKRPIVCPSCSTEFVSEVKVKARRGRAAAVNEDVPVKASPATAAEGDTPEVEEEEEDGKQRQVVSLDEAALEEDGADEDEDLADGDLELDDDELDDDDLEDDLDIDAEKETP